MNYVDDHYSIKARSVGIDATKAEALRGVAGVLTAKDVADIDPYYNGRALIAIEKAHYVGEPVAAVAAEDEQIAQEALSLIKVDYEEIPSSVGLEEALRKGAPLVHDDQKDNICSGPLDGLPDSPPRLNKNSFGIG